MEIGPTCVPRVALFRLLELELWARALSVLGALGIARNNLEDARRLSVTHQ